MEQIIAYIILSLILVFGFIPALGSIEAKYSFGLFHSKISRPYWSCLYLGTKYLGISLGVGLLFYIFIWALSHI